MGKTSRLPGEVGAAITRSGALAWIHQLADAERWVLSLEPVPDLLTLSACREVLKRLLQAAVGIRRVSPNAFQSLFSVSRSWADAWSSRCVVVMVVLHGDRQAHAIPDGKVARQAGVLLKRQLAPAVGWVKC